jgi:hypothetical protein
MLFGGRILLPGRGNVRVNLRGKWGSRMELVRGHIFGVQVDPIPQTWSKTDESTDRSRPWREWRAGTPMLGKASLQKDHEDEDAGGNTDAQQSAA